jgi:probable O-glycosylation ligase (exosortase A-associated)
VFHTGESPGRKTEKNETERLAFSCAVSRSSDASGSVKSIRLKAEPASPPEPVHSSAPKPEYELFAFRATLAFTFVLFVRPQDTIPALQMLHLADVTAIVGLAALIMGRAGRGASVIRVTPELMLVLALGAMMIFTAPFSVWPGGAVSVFTDLYSKVILVFLLIVNTVTTRERFERFTHVVVLGTSYVAVRAVFDYFRGVNVIGDGRVVGAVSGMFGNPNDMALNMVAFLPLALVLALDPSRPVVRMLALVGTPAIAASIIFTKSRGGFVGLVVMLAILLYQLRRIRPQVAIAVVVAVFFSLPFLPDSFLNRMSSIVNAEEDTTGSREARKTLLREGWSTFLANPVFGVGAGQFKNYDTDNREAAWNETHNAALQVAAELGIGGLAIFTAMIVGGFRAMALIRRSIRRAQENRRARAPAAVRARRDWFDLYATGIAASLTGWFVAAMFASVAYYWSLYVILALSGSLRDITQRELPGAADPRGMRAEAA